MRVQQIMRTELHCCGENSSLQQASLDLGRGRAEELVVLRTNGTPMGILNRHGIVAAVSRGLLPNTPVGNLRYSPFGQVTIDTQLGTLVDTSYTYWIVVEQDQLVGLVRRSELDRILTGNPTAFFARLEPVLDGIGAPILAVDGKRRVLLVNQAACREIGHAREDLLGRPITAVLESCHADVPPLVTGGARTETFRLHGQVYLTSWAAMELHGKPLGELAFLRDISAYTSLSTELDRVTDLSMELNAIIDSSFDGIYVTDGASKTLRVNRAYERISGIKSSEVVGRTMVDLVAEGFYNESATLKVLEEKRPVTIVQQIIKTGKTIVVTGNPVFDDSGGIFRVVTNVRDVTELNQLQEKLKKMEQLQSRYEMELKQLRGDADDQRKFVIKSKKMLEIYGLALKLAKVDSTILIQGDSGVGKEVFSEIVHKHGARRNKPFVKISCAAIPENLLESELFGYAPGAFTGAIREGRAGIFEVAHGGTIFLDEIGELPMSLQVKLLRVLQEREIVRVGGSRPIKVDTRIMAATNRDLEEMVRQKQFRKDLFFRLNVVPVLIPSLRERREAISHFIYFFLDKHNQKYGFSRQITPETVDALVEYDWPGNVRELENMIERMVVMAQGEIITADDLPGRVRGGQCADAPTSLEGKPLKIALAELEQQLLRAALEKHGSSRKAAAVLGIDQSTVVRKAGRLGIRVGE
nr:sigma 54-interacting transcriptional regulator [uncultured Desulfobulbus sp.]